MHLLHFFRSATTRAVGLVLIGLCLAATSAVGDEFSGFPERPAGVDATKWASLKAAILEAKLLPTPSGISAPNDNLGISVSLSGDRALLGASRLLGTGGAVIFRLDGGSWTQEAVLTPSDGGPEDFFGGSVSLAGDRALVGASSDDVGSNGNQGSAYVFDFDGSSWSETQKLTASDGAGGDQFGSPVSLAGDRALVGAPTDDVGSNGNQGSAYVFDFDGSSWSETQKLTASDGAVGDLFGSSVSLSGDRALVGARFDDVGSSGNQGSAYVFDFDGSSWSETQKLTASDGAGSDLFGLSIGLAGDRALLGAPGDNAFQGSAYVFDFDGSSWSETQKLTASDGAGGDQFGSSVSLAGDRTLVGAPSDDVGSNGSQGSAYVFDFDGSSWSETQKLTASDGAGFDSFGFSVSLSGNRALLGAPFGNVGSNGSQGSAYVFDFDGISWSETQKLTASEGAGGDRFGSSVSLSGDRALVGAPGDNAFQGSAYVFDFDGSSWSETQNLTASDGAANDRFGSSVSLSGDRALVGADSDDVGSNDTQGSAYVFDFDGSSWSETQKLTASDGAASDEFGGSVSLSGNRALVGAFLDDVGSNFSQGSAYVFDFDGSSWSETQKLTASDGAGSDFFGRSVSLSADRALVGADSDDGGSGSNQGSAYVFDFDGSSWSETQKLTATDGAASDLFGFSVSLAGDRALLGARGDSAGEGSAYLFDFDGSSWSETQKLTASDGQDSDLFGFSVSLAGDRALVGALLDNSIQGSAYVFDFDGGSWSEIEKLTASDGAEVDRFGSSVSLDGTRTLIGASLDDDNGAESGSAYVIGLERFAVGGMVSNLSGTLVLRNNGSNDLSLMADGPFTFSLGLADGRDYAVTVRSDPAGQTCTVSDGSGTISSADVTTVKVNCVESSTIPVQLQRFEVIRAER